MPTIFAEHWFVFRYSIFVENCFSFPQSIIYMFVFHRMQLIEPWNFFHLPKLLFFAETKEKKSSCIFSLIKCRCVRFRWNRYHDDDQDAFKWNRLQTNFSLHLSSLLLHFFVCFIYTVYNSTHFLLNQYAFSLIPLFIFCLFQ